MEIKILVFGSLVEIVGNHFIQLKELPSQTSIHLKDDIQYDTNSITESLKIKFPELSKMKFVISVDRNIIHENTIIHSSSEIAILPPFSGG